MLEKIRSNLLEIVAETNTYEAKLKVLATISNYLEELGSKLIVVGNSAVLMYTTAGKIQEDVEIIIEGYANGRNLLRQLGFMKIDNQKWCHDEIRLNFEIAGYEFQGDVTKLVIFEIDDKLTITVCGYEDLIVERLYRLMHWGDLSGQEEALSIMSIFTKFIDFDYLRSRAKKEKVIGLLEELLEEMIKMQKVINI